MKHQLPGRQEALRLVLADKEAAQDETLRHIAHMHKQHAPRKSAPVSTFHFSSGVDELTPEARALLPF